FSLPSLLTVHHQSLPHSLHDDEKQQRSQQRGSSRTCGALPHKRWICIPVPCSFEEVKLFTLRFFIVALTALAICGAVALAPPARWSAAHGQQYITLQKRPVVQVKRKAARKVAAKPKE